jgi:hypothetical protein
MNTNASVSAGRVRSVETDRKEDESLVWVWWRLPDRNKFRSAKPMTKEQAEEFIAGRSNYWTEEAKKTKQRGR